MRRLLTIVILFFTTINLSAQPESILKSFDSGNQAYADNDFGVAITNYQKIVNANYESAELYYNLGNAYFKQNNIALAILNYERALRLSPRDEDIIYNLEYANKFVKDDFTEVPEFILDRIYNGIVKILSSNAWALVSINTFILALAVFLIFLFSKIISRRKLAFFASILLLMFSVVTFSFSATSKNKLTEPNSAIIMEISTIKSSPDKEGTDLFILNPGVKVGIKSSSGEWFEVRLPNGKVGWILKDDLVII